MEESPWVQSVAPPPLNVRKGSDSSVTSFQLEEYPYIINHYVVDVGLAPYGSDVRIASVSVA